MRLIHVDFGAMYRPEIDSVLSLSFSFSLCLSLSLPLYFFVEQAVNLYFSGLGCVLLCPSLRLAEFCFVLLCAQSLASVSFSKLS